ncbi:MAG: helicase-associated domain-containing protein [Bacilli bacterium]
MRLSECLNQSDISRLRRIAVRQAISCSLYSKNALLQAILASHAEPEHMPARLQSISGEALQAIQEIALDGRLSYAEEELFAVLQRAASGPQAAGDHDNGAPSPLGELLEEGILFELGRPSRKTYVCPSDVWKRLSAITAQVLRDGVQRCAHEPVLYRFDGSAMARDAVTCLLFFARQDVKLTQDGVIFKRQQNQLLQLLEIAEEPLPAHSGWRFGFGRRFHDYPDRFALIYDHLCVEDCIIEEPHGQLRVDRDASAAYMARTEDERARALLRFYVRTYRSAIRTLTRVAARIGRLTAHDWVYGESMLQALGDLMTDYYYEPKASVFDRRIMQMLVCLGVLMKGQGENGAPVYKLSVPGALWLNQTEELDTVEPDQPMTPAAVIQPTFDILLPAESDSAYGWDLQQVAAAVTRDRMCIYRLTRDSVYAALQTGWTETGICEFLARISDRRIPGNVEQTIRGWCNEYGRVTLLVCCVLHCRDEHTLADIERFAPLRDRRIGRFGERTLAFSPEQLEDLSTLLKKLGYLVKTTVTEASQAADAKSDSATIAP